MSRLKQGLAGALPQGYFVSALHVLRTVRVKCRVMGILPPFSSVLMYLSDQFSGSAETTALLPLVLSAAPYFLHGLEVQYTFIFSANSYGVGEKKCPIGFCQL